jgi:hypothetical protein
MLKSGRTPPLTDRSLPGQSNEYGSQADRARYLL